MRLLCEAETLYSMIRGFFRWLATRNSAELIPTVGHVFDDDDGGRCERCGALE